MKKRRLLIALLCAALLLGAVYAIWSFYKVRASSENQIAGKNAANFSTLLNDLVSAVETPSDGDAQRIDADLDAIRAISTSDWRVADAIAERWRLLWLDAGYELYLYHGDGNAPELQDAGIPDSADHAIVVLGYELADGQMQPELVGRCEAAAAMARRFPAAILICTGGATGANNTEGNTEAGLMKAYLAESCGIDPARIFTDESAMTTAENALNTFKILQAQGVRTMTIVTSVYHQRWGQAVYQTVGALYRRDHGYETEIVGNYSYDIDTSVPAFQRDARIAASQIAGILSLPRSAQQSLPSMRDSAPPVGGGGPQQEESP